MKSAYLIPDTPGANMKPGQEGVKFVPITRMTPRSFITNLTDGASVTKGAQTLVRGIAFGGDNGVTNVDLSLDGGASWRPAALGKDEGKYSFRSFEAHFTPEKAGDQAVMVRCTNQKGEVQPMEANWNPSGFMRNLVETVTVKVG